MFCKNCGKKLGDEVAFCDECGTSVTQPNPVFVPAPAPVATPAPIQQQARPVTQVNIQNQLPNNPLMQPLSVGGYIGMMLLSAIPIVGIILIFVWAFSSDVNINKRNYCRAILILALIMTVLSIVISVVFGGLIAMIMSSM